MFANECAAYVRDSHVGFSYERDPSIGSIKVRLHQEAPPPALLGAIVGDILHNLRSALDAVAWAACQQVGGLTRKQESAIYFPISGDPSQWPSQAARKLPGVEGSRLEVFRQLQPWFWEETAKGMGVPVLHSSIENHPLAQLDQLAMVDRHRVFHPVLARAGDTWLGSPDGVVISVVAGSYRLADPGEVVLEWRVDPPGAVHDVQPDGDVTLAFSQEAARYRRSAYSELGAMVSATAQALRKIEVEVLELATPTQMDHLNEEWLRLQDAEGAVDSLISSPHVIDQSYLDRYNELTTYVEIARRKHSSLWRELFE
jgi:plasmid stabilization system protein ParE